jgi:hypothetical protein
MPRLRYPHYFKLLGHFRTVFGNFKCAALMVKEKNYAPRFSPETHAEKETSYI